VKRILLCSSSPLLVKGLYATLRDGGYAVESVEHPTLAVRRVLEGAFDCAIMDAEPFGLSAEEAAQILGTIAPGMPILCIGGGPGCERLPLITIPPDLAAIRQMVHLVAA
jgi:DNA-binding response OmpR family regulator